MVNPSKWVRPTNDAASMRLFCFAHAGGGTSLFHPWRTLLTPEIDVCPVLLPGRESRRRETPIRRAAELIEPMFDALLPLVDRPYALFGHSMGTILAFELARRFSTRHWRRPTTLIVSGRRAPHLPARRPAYWALPEEEFLASIAALNGTPAAMLDQPDLRQLFLPALRADFELTERYTPPSGSPLNCAIEVFFGADDPEINIDEATAWQRWTTGSCVVRPFPGDHFYLSNGRTDVVTVLRAALSLS